MKKTYLLEGLDCANCAAEVERNVAKLDNVNSASVNFLTLKMVLDVNEEGFDETYKKIVKTVKKTEPDVHALFTRGHIEPHLEHVVGHQDEKHTDRCHQNPGPPHILPVGNRPDRILPQLIEPFHISPSPYILESF